jgi:hypothetical protein
MGNAQKHIFWSEQYPNVNYSLCHIIEPNTWRHILLCCAKPHIHKPCINRHNKAVHHKISTINTRKLLISNTNCGCFTLINARKFNRKPQENIVPNWLLPCNCRTHSNKCQCNARLRSNILCIRNLPNNSKPPTRPQQNLTIQFIEFTYYNDRYSLDKIQEKTAKYDNLINDIKAQGWNVDPILMLTAGA